MRMISSRTLVGSLLPPTNCPPLFGEGKIPALRSACALGSSNAVGIVLFGNGLPGVRPRLVRRVNWFGESLLAAGTLMVLLYAPEYRLVSGTVCFTRPPCPSLRHSMLKKKKVLFRSLL